MPLSLSAFTLIGWSILPRIDAKKPCPFTLKELEEAIDRRAVMELLVKLDDQAGLIAAAADMGGKELNEAMCDAGEAFSGRWERKADVGKDVTCCVMAMVFEAIQQQFKS